MIHPAYEQIAVLGLGLMGGSFAMAARQARLARFIVGFDPDREALVHAVSTGTIEQAASDIRDAVADAALIVLAAPVRAILELLERLAPHVQPGTLVLDLGSTKRLVVAHMNRLPDGVRAVGGHPMCGKEVAGLRHAEATLFKDATFALCPTRLTDETARQEVEGVVRALQAVPLWLTADDHDRLVAAVSHLPYLLSSALVQTALNADDLRARQLAASGFRDTSRLAASDVRMMLDIVMTNADLIAETLDHLGETIGELADAIRRQDESALHAFLTTGAERRRAWYAEKYGPPAPPTRGHTSDEHPQPGA
ncbi:MAG: prephenate dehydrogenase [Ardenticatenia bacterium]|nr:prephenate dehydrogenase [Ardenticatenia bacterium]